MAMTAAVALHLSNYYRNEAKKLEAEHGTGVRPAWVSTDIHIALQQSKYYAALAKDLKHA